MDRRKRGRRGMYGSELEVGEVSDTRGLVVGPGTIDVLVERAYDEALAAIYGLGAGSIVALIDRTTGVVIGSRWD